MRIGCADLPPGLRRARYFERLDYLEVQGTRYQIPKDGVLRRWTRETAGRGRFGLVAPQVITHTPGRRGYRRGDPALTAEELAQAGGFRTTEVVARATAQLVHAARLVAAEVVVFRSPADFTPSTTHRDALRRFFTEIAPASAFGSTARVWEPAGLWEPAAAAHLAAELGVLYACDPMPNDPLGPGPEFFAQLPGGRAYFRLTGLGRARQRFDDYAMAELLDIAAGYDTAWLVFAHDYKYPEAIRLKRALDR